MASPKILFHLKNVLSPRDKSPCKTLTSFSSNAITKTHLFENKLSTPKEYKITVSPLKSLFLDEHPNTKKELYRTPIKRKLYCNDQVEKLPSVDTPERKKLLDRGLESSSNWQILGKGGFGTVVKARYRGKELAVKIVPKTRKHASSSLKEEQNAIKLKHLNVVQVFQVIDADTNYGLVLMEQWCQTNLEKLINDGAVFSLQQKLRILWNVGKGLEHCHQNGILHLDIKPTNILVRLSDVSSKLCDFGSSLNINTPVDPCLPLFRGTIQYMSPELLQGRKPTCKSDVYSMGITMWQLLHEAMPYPSENVYAIAYKVVSQNYRPKTEKEDIKHKNLVALYKSCWEPNPVDRPHILQFVQQIKQCTHF